MPWAATEKTFLCWDSVVKGVVSSDQWIFIVGVIFLNEPIMEMCIYLDPFDSSGKHHELPSTWWISLGVGWKYALARQELWISLVDLMKGIWNGRWTCWDISILELGAFFLLDYKVMARKSFISEFQMHTARRLRRQSTYCFNNTSWERSLQKDGEGGGRVRSTCNSVEYPTFITSKVIWFQPWK